MPDEKLPRLGDRAELRIEIMPSAITTYRQTIEESFRGARTLTEAEAREELDDVLRVSYVVYSNSETMRVRGRVRRLEVDVESQLLRITPDHVRCLFARARRLDTRKAKAGSGRDGGCLVQAPGNKGRLGYVRATPKGTIEWREIAPGNGDPAPPWGPPPPNLRELAIDHEREGRPRLREWLRRHGVE